MPAPRARALHPLTPPPAPRSVKRRAKDLDQIQDELRAVAAGRLAVSSYRDEDAPGGGAFFCVECSRHCVNDAALVAHRATKSHKRQLKTVAEQQYTQKEADAAAGMSH